MFDLAVPLFNLQHLWGVYRSDAQVLMLNRTSGDMWEGVDFYARRMVITPDPKRSVFRLTWDRDATWTANYTRSVLGDSGDGLVCFKVGAQRRAVGMAVGEASWWRCQGAQSKPAGSAS